MKRFKKIIILFALLIIGYSCSDSFFDINQDPNNPSDATVQLVLPTGLSSSCYVIDGWWQIVGGLWAQHWTQSTGASQYRDVEDYQITSSSFDRQFSELYAGALNDLEFVKKKSLSEENYTYYLMATVTQSYVFQVLADLYDQIPFSEALKGDEGIILPKYDNGQDVYDSLIVRIDKALSYDITTSNNQTPGADDLFFKGNMTHWVEFANSLKLKIFMRQVYARESVAKAGITAMISDGASFLTADVAMTQFANEQNRRNPVYETGVDRLSGNISGSRTTVGYLVDNDDVRLDYLYNKPSAGGNHNTLVQGDYKNSTPTNISGLSTPKLAYSDGAYLMTVAEVKFLLAEAAIRWPELGLNAKTYYDAGVTAAYAKYGLSAKAATAIATGGAYAFNTSGSFEAKLQQIIVQKWLSMVNSQGIEAWQEYNRTGYPVLSPSLNNSTGGQMPKRFLFSSDERASNPLNVPAKKEVYEKVWWDKK